MAHIRAILLTALLAAGPAAAQTGAPPSAASGGNIETLGACAWRALGASERNRLENAALNGGAGRMMNELNDVAKGAAPLLEACDAEAADHMDRSARMMTAWFSREAMARAIQRDSGLSRDRLTAALDSAPTALKAAMIEAARQSLAGQPVTAGADVRPLFGILGLPDDQRFIGSDKGQRILAFYQFHARVLVLGEDGDL